MGMSEFMTRAGRVTTGMPKTINSRIRQTGNRIKNVAQFASNAVTNGVKSASTAVTNGVKSASTAVTNGANAVTDRVKSVASKTNETVKKTNQHFSDRADRRDFQKTGANQTNERKEKVIQYYNAEYTRLSNRTGTVNDLIDGGQKITSRHVMGKGNRDNLIKLLQRINNHDGGKNKILVSKKVKTFLETIKSDKEAKKINFETVAMGEHDSIDLNKLEVLESTSPTRFQKFRDSNTVKYATQAAQTSGNITGGVAGTLLNDRNIVGASVNGVLKTSAAVTGGTLGLLAGVTADAAMGIKHLLNNRGQKKADVTEKAEVLTVSDNNSQSSHSSTTSPTSPTSPVALVTTSDDSSIASGVSVSGGQSTVSIQSDVRTVDSKNIPFPNNTQASF